jgi:hypothetical protein
MATTTKNQRSSKKRNEYLSDVRDAMEHIVAAGSRIRHDGWRFDEWNIRQEEQKLLIFQQNSKVPQHSPQEQQQVLTPMPTTMTPQNLHAEDIRIYGTNGIPKEPWPKRRRAASDRRTVSNDQDDEWDIEHGDTIHPISFSMAKLSQLPPIEQQQQQQLKMSPSSLDQDQEMDNNRMINGNNLHVATTKVEVSQDQVPRALVLKCWERAVHAASCTVLTPIPCTTKVPTAAAKKHDIHPTWQPAHTITSSRRRSGGSSTNQSDRRSNSSPAVDHNNHVQRDFSNAAAIAKCKSWKIDLSSLSAARRTAATNHPNIELSQRDSSPVASFLICPSCTLECETLEQLQRHYYGDDVHSQKGCCWILLASKHRSMMNQVLQRHVETQADQLLQVLLTKAKVRIQQQQQEQGNDHGHSSTGHCSNQRLGRLLNWHDVLELAQSTLDSSSRNHLSGTTAEGIGRPGSPGHNHHPAWETLQVQHGKTGLVLNQYILNAVQRRLMDRYANVPF